MKKQTSVRAPSDPNALREEYYLKRVREFGEHYKEFEWSSVELLLSLLRSHEMIWSHFSRLMHSYGLSPAIFNILMILSQSKGEKLKQHEISKLLLVSRANVTGLVNGLVRKGLAKRTSDRNDRRAWLVQITRKGKDLLEKYIPTHYGEVRRVLSGFNANEKKQFNAFFYKLEDGVRKCSERK